MLHVSSSRHQSRLCFVQDNGVGEMAVDANLPQLQS